MAWLRPQQADWAEGNGFAGHLWWHKALFHLEAMDLEGVLRLHDAHQDSAHAAADAAARGRRAPLLWRLNLLGADVGARWADLAQGWDLTARDAGHSAFNDAACADDADRHRRRCRHAGAALGAVPAPRRTRSDANAAMARESRPAADARPARLDAGDAAGSIALLAPLRETAHRFGGSHAQRDLIELTLLAACALPGGGWSLGQRAAQRAALARGH